MQHIGLFIFIGISEKLFCTVSCCSEIFVDWNKYSLFLLCFILWLGRKILFTYSSHCQRAYLNSSILLVYYLEHSVRRTKMAHDLGSKGKA